MKDWDDEKFLGYMETHSQSERALFRNDYCKRLQVLAGVEPTGDDEQWFSWHYEDMKPYLDAAREKLRT